MTLPPPAENISLALLPLLAAPTCSKCGNSLYAPSGKIVHIGLVDRYPTLCDQCASDEMDAWLNEWREQQLRLEMEECHG